MRLVGMLRNNVLQYALCRKRDKKSKEAAPAKSIDQTKLSPDYYRALPDNIENMSLAKIKSYAKKLGRHLIVSERKKLIALLKSKGVKGDALRELEEQISLGLTRDN